jgi:hypothetical protein
MCSRQLFDVAWKFFRKEKGARRLRRIVLRRKNQNRRQITTVKGAAVAPSGCGKKAAAQTF